MRILLEAHHPAHVHFWKYPVRELQKRGHEVLMIGRDRDVMKRLLEVYDWIPSIIPPRKSKKNRFPIFEMLQRQWLVGKEIRNFRPDVVASLMGSYTQTAKLFGIRNVVFTDSEFQHFNHRVAHPFADEIYTPECFYKELGPKQIRYKGIHELAFLHPDYFDARAVLAQHYPEFINKAYAVIRLSAWNTFHDLNHSGIGARLGTFIDFLGKRFEVIIVAEESAVPKELLSFAVNFPPEDFHAVLSGASFVLTEGASTASEAACLAIPTVYINSTEPRGYLQMLERRYNLLRSFSDVEEGLKAARAMVLDSDDATCYELSQKSKSHRRDSIDVVDYVMQVLTQIN